MGRWGSALLGTLLHRRLAVDLEAAGMESGARFIRFFEQRQSKYAIGQANQTAIFRNRIEFENRAVKIRQSCWLPPFDRQTAQLGHRFLQKVERNRLEEILQLNSCQRIGGQNNTVSIARHL